jgi:hypothetical protein
MSDRYEDVSALFRAARRLEDPSVEERARLRRRMAGLFGATLTVSTGFTGAATAAAAAAPAAPLLPTLALPFATGALLGGVVAVGANWSNVERALEAPPRPAAVSSVAPGSSARPRAPVFEPVPVPAASFAPPSSSASAPAGTTVVAAPPPGRTGSSPVTAPALSLEAESHALARIQRALRDGDPERALVLIAEQEGSFQKGALAEERAAARVFALCAAGRRAETAAAARRFLVDFPKSPLRVRVAASCAPASDP